MKTGDRESGSAATRPDDGLTGRGVIAGLTSLLAAPNPSSAQQTSAKLPRVGWIWAGGSAGNPTEVAGFRQALKELGYIEGQNIVVDYRFGEGRDVRLADLAAELLQLRPDALVAVADAPVRAIRSITTNVPIVLMVGDPVAQGFVASLARPGGNITGVSMMSGAEGLAARRVELLREAVPAAVRVALMFNRDFPGSVSSLTQAQDAANRLGLVIRASPMRPGDDIEEAIAALSREGVGVDIEPVLPFITYPRETGEFLLKYRLPAVSEVCQIAESGGLL